MTGIDPDMRVIPVKTLMWAVGSFLSGLSLSLVLFSQIILPAIMRDVMVEIRTSIEKHEGVPHRVSVSRAEFDMMREAVTSQNEQVLANLRAMSDKIDRLHAN